MVLFGLITVYLFASVFHVVRNYGDYGLVSGGFTVCLFCLWYLVTGSESRLLLAFAVLSMLALAVEVDNYWQGTSYLRFEFGGDPDEV